MLALMLAPISAEAAQKKTVKTTWSQVCGKDKSGADVCQISQTIVDGKKRKIARFTVAMAKTGPFLEVSAPLRLYIPFGMQLQVDDGPQIAMQMIECAADGCRAVMPLDDDGLQRMRAGKRITLHIMDTQSGKQIAIAGSLVGFQDAFAKIAAVQ